MSSQISDQKVEYAYSFDVAVNSFFPAFLTLHLGLAVLGGVLVKANWVCLFVGKYVYLNHLSLLLVAMELMDDEEDEFQFNSYHHITTYYDRSHSSRNPHYPPSSSTSSGE